MGIASYRGVTKDGAGCDVYAARWSSVAGLALAALVLAALATTGDAVGAVLAGAAALVPAGVAAYDALLRPSLVAGPDGLEVRTGPRPRRYAWGQVTRVEVVTTRRLLVLHALEIDAGDDLLLLGKRRLGADLEEVAARLAEHRRAAGDGPAPGPAARPAPPPPR